MADENKYNIKIECGTDFVLPFVWTDDNGNPVDLTGATVSAQLREYSGSPDALDFICTHNNAGGRIMLVMPNEVTKQITYSYGVYDVNVTLASGVVKHPLYGEAKIQDNVTKPLDGEMLYTVAIESYDKLPAQGLLNRLYYIYAEQMILRWNGTNYVSAFEFFELHPEGAWNEDTAYQKYATVTNAGSSYMALKNVPEGIDIHNTAYWLKLAEAGGAENIDDDAGEGDTTKTWSADKLTAEFYKRELANGKVFYFFPNMQNSGVGENCFLVVTPSKTIMFDGGGQFSSLDIPLDDANWYLLRDWLDGLMADGVFTNIDMIVISHYHSDHVLYLDNILQRYPHTGCHAYIPNNNTVRLPTNEYNVCITALTNNQVDYTMVTEDTVLPIDTDTDGNVLTDITLWNVTPEDYAYYDAISSSIPYNNFSMVSIFRHGEMKTMFPGDLQVAGQTRLLAVHDVPKVFLYQVHHHDVQNNDNIRYLKTIQPDYSVSPSGHQTFYRSSAINGYINKVVSDTKFCYLFNSEAIFMTSMKSGVMLKGSVSNPISITDYTPIEVYLNNEYTGDIIDGSEEHPFKDLYDVFANFDINIPLKIYLVPTNTPYKHIRIYRRNYIIITGLTVSGTIPQVANAMIYYSNNITFENLNINGSLLGNGSMVNVVNSSIVHITNCKINGSNITNPPADYYGIQLNRATVYIGNIDVSDIKYPFAVASNYGEFYFTGTFNITNATELYPFKGYVRAYSVTYNLTNVTYIARGTGDGFVLNNWEIFYTNLSKINNVKFVSKPFYYNSSNPVAIIANKKLYNVLTGDEITA